MLISVPQYIDVEDKIVGPLTAKQLGWLIALGVSLLFMWKFLDRVNFFLIGIPITFLFIALAFYRPYGQTFGSFLLNGLLYLFNSKVYVWQRTPHGVQAISTKRAEIKRGTVANQKEGLSPDELRSLSRVIDTSGSQSDEHILEILRKSKINNK